MNFRQRLLKAVYPLIMKLSRRSKNGKVLENRQRIAPAASFYDLKALDNRGNEVPFAQFRGKKVLVVNTASNCGYTNQYEALQQLYQGRRDDLVIVGFPANDFKEQERSNDQEIAQFCQVNFGVTFPLMKKAQVVKGPQQHPVFQWLSQPERNGWNPQAPDWNFSKYLIDEKGQLTHYFGPAVAPDSPEVQEALQKNRSV
ncbi:glutathione peroxidase [Catalinimonas alkaloidigena]|uniref:Glutathione peroxidase n=1 Tax=Catalinimonas alkaloidigena TaxID=1075417 RepID=A0A1G9H5Y8_9BACT|nr:glutathione peroxidase [Catalinimonas alkaloidigena]SDL08269.1 glutathione peroxidase [Catalinimonas alkaloidigena]